MMFNFSLFLQLMGSLFIYLYMNIGVGLFVLNHNAVQQIDNLDLILVCPSTPMFPEELFI